jgi:hypothetical protein
MIKSNNYTNT